MAGLLELPEETRSDCETGLLRRVLHWGLQLRIWVALCVSALAHFSYRTMGAAPTTEGQTTLLAVVFFSTLALYNLDGSLDARSPSGDSNTRRQAHRLLTAMSFAGLLLLVPLLPDRAALLTCLGLVGCSLYNLPSSPKLPRSGLKFIPGMKAPFVGVSVSSAVVWVTALAHPSPIDFPISAILWLTLCTYCTANALLFDIPDLQEDEKSQVPTVARSRGVALTQRAALKLALVGFLLWPLGLLVFRGPAVFISRISEIFALSTLGVFLMFCARRVDKSTGRSKIAWSVDGGLLLPAVIYPMLVAVRDGFR